MFHSFIHLFRPSNHNNDYSNGEYYNITTQGENPLRYEGGETLQIRDGDDSPEARFKEAVSVLAA